jgi:hypothetical protein
MIDSFVSKSVQSNQVSKNDQQIRRKAKYRWTRYLH